jgi:hypothetical protein
VKRIRGILGPPTFSKKGGGSRRVWTTSYHANIGIFQPEEEAGLQGHELRVEWEGKQGCQLHRDGGTSNECLLIVNDPPYGNERVYNGLRLTIIADRVQEPRP